MIETEITDSKQEGVAEKYTPVVRPSYKAMWKEILLIIAVVTIITFTIGPIVDLTRDLMNQVSKTLPTYVVASIYNNSTYVSFFLIWALTCKILYRKYATELFFNREYVELKIGIFATKTIQLKLAHITAIEANQTIIEKILGIGTLEVMASSTSELEIIIHGIPNPHHVAKSIRDYI